MTQTVVKERPIIFSSKMVKAVLDGRKTQTRRVILRPERFTRIRECDFCCPYGQVGDRLWLRETWRIESFMEGEPLLFGYKDGSNAEENEYSDNPRYEPWYERICSQSTDDAAKAYEKGLCEKDDGDIYRWDIGNSPCHWRSGRFMPKWAARIWLEITAVRAERLASISPSDCLSEGIRTKGMARNWKIATSLESINVFAANWYIHQFRTLWDSLNAKRAYGWDTNPWVWVLELKRIDR